MDRIEARLDGFDERLRDVEISFGKLDQRLLTIRAGRPPRGERRQQLPLLSTATAPVCGFRGKPITDSGRNRSLIPIQTDH